MKKWTFVEWRYTVWEKVCPWSYRRYKRVRTLAEARAAKPKNGAITRGNSALLYAHADTLEKKILR